MIKEIYSELLGQSFSSEKALREALEQKIRELSNNTNKTEDDNDIEIEIEVEDSYEVEEDNDSKQQGDTDGEVIISPYNKDSKEVEAAFGAVHQLKKENKAKREELDKKWNEIVKDAGKKIDELESIFRNNRQKVEEQKEADLKALGKKFDELDELEKEQLDAAYKKLSAFCKKYGVYPIEFGLSRLFNFSIYDLLDM